MIFKTFRFRIILCYMALLSLTIFAFSFALYSQLKKVHHKGIDEYLCYNAHSIIAALDHCWEIEKEEARKEGIEPDSWSRINNINFLKIIQRWVEEEAPKTSLVQHNIIQILDPEGGVIAFSQNIPGSIIFPDEFLYSAIHGEKRYDTVSVTLPPKEELLLRLYTVPVFENGKLIYTLQLGRSFSAIKATLDNFKAQLFILLPLTVFLTGIIGTLLAKIVLRPIGDMVDTVNRITAKNLTLRLPVPSTNDEMQKLGDTFNEMLERIEKAFLSQKHFIQDASHELKTPITILKGDIEVALNRPRTPSEYESTLKSNLEEIERISRIVDNLLMLARFDDNASSMSKEPLDFAYMIDSVVDDISVMAEEKKIVIKKNLIQSGTVEGDKNQLKQLIVIILDNAIKYTNEGGSINVVLSKEDSLIKVVVEDTGEGIPARDLPQVFDRFFRVDRSRSTKGFGLGLSIAKSIVTRHNGSISIESSLNKGTSVTVAFKSIKSF